MDFAEHFKKGIFHITDRDFNEKALELFRYQAQNNPVYSKFIRSLKKDLFHISSIEFIPFLPIGFFKTQEIKTGHFLHELIFRSSGTTARERSSHFIKDSEFYKIVARKSFETFYGKPQDYTFLALLPSYLENKDSSLIYMINYFIDLSGGASRYLSPDFSDFLSSLEEARKLGKKIILWGVTYALLDLAESVPIDLSDITVIETGGMKGRRKEITREELHSFLKERLNLKKVDSEYGMTELLSQAYSKEEGLFSCPPWMKVMIHDLNDPFSQAGQGREGIINIIDLANVDSCAFIGTEDLGKTFEKDKFQVRGRMDNSDVRGCNLLNF
jgi:phenylacetate-coenzyme A ligase PaaK-like adenylate-forming protein